MTGYIVLISQDAGVVELVADGHYWVSAPCTLPDAVVLAYAAAASVGDGWVPSAADGWDRHVIVPGVLEPVGGAVADAEYTLELAGQLAGE